MFRTEHGRYRPGKRQRRDEGDGGLYQLYLEECAGRDEKTAMGGSTRHQRAAPQPNLANGEKLYQLGCASCHGVDGAGNGGGPTVGPALWGEDSFNIGAGMGRIRTAAGYIQRYMPKIQMGVHAPGTLTTQEAVDLAAYILSKPRPDLAKKEKDWPKNEQPDDVAYMTLAMRKAGMDEKSLPWYTAYAERAMKKAAQPVDSPSSDSESPQK
ncbi:hypothetical protein CULT_70058 [[Clostridium] ultunense Esp]|nr:hypothetical protein CULT_70058 [[Clostridium] ultunense Esp]